MIRKKQMFQSGIMLSAVVVTFHFSENCRPDQWNKSSEKTIPIIFFEEKFEDTNFTLRGWYDYTVLSLSAKEHIPASTRSAEYRWQKGDTKPVNGSAIRRKFTESNEVYISFWVKYSSNYTGSNKPYHPHEFLLMTNKNGDYDGPAFTHLTAYIEQNESKPLLALQDGQNIDQAKIKQDLRQVTENRSVHGCNGVYLNDNTSVDCYNAGGGTYWNGQQWKATSPMLSDSTWHHAEAYLQLNSIRDGKAIEDGILKYWLDNKLLINHTNVLMRTGQFPDMKFNQFIIAPWIGDGSPADQAFWIDDLIIGNVRPN